MVRQLFELYLKSDERYELVESLSSAAQVEDYFDDLGRKCFGRAKIIADAL